MPLLLASLHTSSQTDLPFSVYEVYVCWRVPQKSKLLKSQKRWYKDFVITLYLYVYIYIYIHIELITLYLLPITLKTVQKRIVKQINAQFHSWSSCIVATPRNMNMIVSEDPLNIFMAYFKVVWDLDEIFRST